MHLDLISPGRSIGSVLADQFDLVETGNTIMLSLTEIGAFIRDMASLSNDCVNNANDAEVYTDFIDDSDLTKLRLVLSNGQVFIVTISEG